MFSVIFVQEFQAHKRQGAGILSRFTDSIHNMSASYMIKNRSPEHTMMSEYIYMFGDKLGTIDRISLRILKEQTGECIVLLHSVISVISLLKKMA